jgi:nucleotide-binding universal stress UspA family protein
VANLIMVPLDGSAEGEQAIPVALALAAPGGADLHLVRVFDVPFGTMSSRAGMLGVTDAADALREEMRSALATTAADLARTSGHRVTSEVLDGADVSELLVRHALARGASVVVMTTRARGALGRAVIGSVADRVARENPVPVVLVPLGGAGAMQRERAIRRVLVPLDGSPLAAQAVDQVLALLGGRDVECVLLEVVMSGVAVAAPGAPMRLSAVDPGEILAGDERRQAAEGEARARLDATARRLKDGGVAVRTRVIVDGDPAAGILGCARDEDVDLIAMTTRGHGGLRRMVLGSIADRVVRASGVPVLLTAPTDRGTKGADPAS